MWGGTLVAAALSVIWVGSSFTNAANQKRNFSFSLGPHRQHAWFINRGLITWIVIPESDSTGAHTSNWVVDSPRLSELDLGFCAPRVFSIPGVPLLNVPDTKVVRIPIWLPFLLVVVPTAYLWYRDGRRIPAGHCSRCGYDLTMNVSGTCPECGNVIEAMSPRSAPTNTDARNAEPM